MERSSRLRVGVVANSVEHFRYSWPQLADGIESTGVELLLAAADSGRVPDGRDVEKIAGVSRRPSLKAAINWREISVWARRNAIDLFLVNTATPAAQVRMAVGSKMPVVYFAHGLHWDSTKGIEALHWRSVERALLSLTAGAIVLNTDDEEWIKRNSASLPLLRLPYGVGVDLGTFHRLPKAARDERASASLLWIGEFNARKQPMRAIEVLQHLIKIGVNAKLVMLGEGPLISAVRDSAKERRLQDRLSLPGKVSPLRYYASCDAVIHTSKWEGFPRVFLEALAVGRRVYAFDAKGARGIEGVINVPQGNSRLLAEVLAKDLGTGHIDKPADVRFSDLASVNAGARIGSFLLQNFAAVPR